MPLDTHTDRRKGLGGAVRFDLAVVCAVIALAAAVLAGLAWSRSTTASSTTRYQQSGSLSYSAPTSPTSIYGAAGVQTGQPVYVGLVRTLSLTYKYQFTSSASTALRGTEQLVATLSMGAEFNRKVPLQAPTAFRGDKFTATTTLHLATIEAMVAAFNKFTVDNGNSYSLSIAPHVTVKGQLGRVFLRSDFNQGTRFSLNETTLTPSSNTPGSSGTAGTSGGPPGRAITSSASGMVKVASAQQAILLAGISVFDARLISLAVLLLAVALGVYLGWPLLQEARSDDERIRIATKLSSSLVEVACLPRSSVTVIELQAFDGLEQVSRRLECPLLHLRSEAGDEYAVVDNGTVYLYRIVDQPAQRLGQVVQASSNSPRHAVVGHGSSATS